MTQCSQVYPAFRSLRNLDSMATEYCTVRRCASLSPARGTTRSKRFSLPPNTAWSRPKGRRYPHEKIIGSLKAHEAGTRVAGPVRVHGISEQSFYRWKARHGGMEISQAMHLEALEVENARLKRLPCSFTLPTIPLHVSLRVHELHPRAIEMQGDLRDGSHGNRLFAEASRWVSEAIEHHHCRVCRRADHPRHSRARLSGARLREALPWFAFEEDQRMTLADFEHMDDAELADYLLSLACCCPIDLPKYCCPIMEFRRLGQEELGDWLETLHRRDKLDLAARHYGCAKWNQRF